MRLASYVVLSATCRVTAVTYMLAFTMVRMINRRGEQNEVALEQCDALLLVVGIPKIYYQFVHMCR